MRDEREDPTEETPGTERVPAAGQEGKAGSASEAPKSSPDDVKTAVDAAKGPADVPKTAADAVKASAQTGKGSRLERLAAARREQRRRLTTRFWYAAVPLVLVVIVAMILLALFGGLEGDEAQVSTSTTVTLLPEEGSGLLLVEEDESLAFAVILQPWEEGGVVLIVPGITLLKSEGVFKTLADLDADGGAEPLVEALYEAFEVLVGPVATVAWSDLEDALTTAGVEEAAAEAPGWQERDEGLLAQALLTFLGGYVSDRGSRLWNGLGLGGDAAEFLDAVGLDAVSAVRTAWSAGTVTGSIVEGDGFIYLDPDVKTAKTLLGATSRPAMISVEVQDGAGVTGAAELAGDLLEGEGYKLLPMVYAEEFPEVETTRIAVAPGMLEDGEQVRALLGVGEVAEDETLAADHLVVVLGKDFIQGPPGETEATE